MKTNNRPVWIFVALSKINEQVAGVQLTRYFSFNFTLSYSKGL